jgi:hypothetical protein
MIDSLLETVNQCEEDQMKTECLTVLIKYLPDDLLDSVYVHACCPGDEDLHSRCEQIRLAVAVEMARRGSVEKAFDLYQRESSWEKMRTLKDLTPFLTSGQQSAALDAARSYRYQDGKHLILLYMIPSISPELLGECLSEVLAIDLWYRRAPALKAMASRLAQAPVDEASAYLAECLKACMFRDRYQAFCDLACLAPLIFAVGGSVAIREAVAAVLDVAKWWRPLSLDSQ